MLPTVTVVALVAEVIINLYRSLCKVPFIFVGFEPNADILDRLLVKYPNIKFHENPSVVSQFVPYVRVDMPTLLLFFYASLRTRLEMSPPPLPPRDVRSVVACESSRRTLQHDVGL